MKSSTSPIIVPHKGFEARIYDRRPTKPCYRVTWQSGGKQVTRERTELADAKKVARDALRDLAKGKTVHLTQKEINDLQVAQDALRQVGVPLVDAVIEFVQAKQLMPNVPLRTAAEAWCDNHDNIKQVAFGKVAEEFLAYQKTRVSARTLYDETLRVNRLRDSLKIDLCDLSKAALELFFEHELSGNKGKTRNHFRQLVKF